MRERIEALLRRRFYTDDDVRALGTAAVPHVVELYRELRRGEGDTWRLALLAMLGVLDGDEGVAFLRGELAGAAGVDETTEIAAAEALARTDHPDALAVVLPLLETGEKRMRRNVLAGLAGSVRAEVQARVRLAAGQDPDEAVREKAAEAARAIEARMAGGEEPG